MSDTPLPIVVDLDGTLSRSDTLHDQVVRAALRHPLRLLAALPALASSRARFKARLAAIPAKTVSAPWNRDVLDALAPIENASVTVCTGSNREFAARLCTGLRPFTAIHGSTTEVNLKGEAKAGFLRETYGQGGFVYYGNDREDLPVWRDAAGGAVVSDNTELLAEAKRVCPAVTHLPPRKPPAAVSLFKALRPHQWVKNLLVFVPLLTSHRFGEAALVRACAAAFAVFCLLSSAIYLLNDAIDLDADRRHASKARRPFASGDVSVLWALPLCAAFLCGGLGGAAALGRPFLAAAAGYVLLSVVYSTGIKKIALLDVYALAALYTLRLFAGGAVTGIVISVWLAAFSIFIFLSLALCKRYVELRDEALPAGVRIGRRGYFPEDARFVLNQGIIAMGCAALVLAIYLSSSAVTLLYKSPSLLWIAVLVVSYWGGRLWLLASRGQMHDDPVLFALRDVVSWACLGLLLAVFFAAMTLG